MQFAQESFVHDILFTLFLWFSFLCAGQTSNSYMGGDVWFQRWHLLLIPTWGSYVWNSTDSTIWFHMDSNIWFLNGQQRLDSTQTGTSDSYGQWHLDSYMDSFLRILKWTATSGSEMDSNVADSHIDNV